MSVRVGLPELYPDNLLSDGEEPGPFEADPGRVWWTIYTRSRQEKALASQLAARHIPFYLPLIDKKTRYGRRTVTSSLPLFPNYVFMFGSEDERVASLATNRISRILAVPNGDDLRRDLIHVRRLIVSGEPLTVESRWMPGQRVRIKRGPLIGLEGTILRREGQVRLLVSVDFLQRGASVAIEDFLLEEIADESTRRSGKIEYS